jgi:hypothetical protein
MTDDGPDPVDEEELPVEKVYREGADIPDPADIIVQELEREAGNRSSGRR